MTKMPPPAAPSGPTLPRAPIVIITGASSGIGRATAVVFARHGWRVGLVARGHAGLEAAKHEVQASGAQEDILVATAVADVSDPDALEVAAVQLEAVLGAADVWINCAGNGTFGRFLDTPHQEFKRVTDVTYMGSVNGTRAALSRMLPRDQGCIVNVCSAVAFHGMPLLSSYSGAKHALRGFTQAVRAELAQDGSRVRLATVFPPAVNTPFFDHAISHMGALGRPMSPVYQPHVIADAIYLAATTQRQEMLISFTTVLFAMGMRLMPGVVSRAIRRLGYAGQLTNDQAAKARHKPTLFAASETASPARGGFDTISRSRSAQVTLLQWLARLGLGRSARPGSAPRAHAHEPNDAQTVASSFRQTAHQAAADESMRSGPSVAAAPVPPSTPKPIVKPVVKMANKETDKVADKVAGKPIPHTPSRLARDNSVEALLTPNDTLV